MTEDLSGKYKGEILEVVGLDEGQVAYNPFPLGLDSSGRSIISARVESADSDWLNKIKNNGQPYDPKIKFFFVEGNKLLPLADAPVFEGLEDPFSAYIKVDGEEKLLFGGVRVDFESEAEPVITTELYLSSGVDTLDPHQSFAVVRGMKDLRFCQSTSGDIIMLTRPTAGDAFPGSIGFTRITFAELTDQPALLEKIKNAKLLKFSFSGGGIKYGPNAIYSKVVNDNKGGAREKFQLVCHTATAEAYFVDDKKIENDFTLAEIHYTAYDCVIDPEKLDEVIHLRLLAQSSDFDLGLDQIKAPRYKDVVFPGGIMNGYLYCGVGDRSIGRIKISG